MREITVESGGTVDVVRVCLDIVVESYAETTAAISCRGLTRKPGSGVFISSRLYEDEELTSESEPDWSVSIVSLINQVTGGGGMARADGDSEKEPDAKQGFGEVRLSGRDFLTRDVLFDFFGVSS
jgi:hypothetical protein